MNKLFFGIICVLFLASCSIIDESIDTRKQEYTIKSLIPPLSTNIQHIRGNYYMFTLNGHKYLGFFETQGIGVHEVFFARID